MDAVCTEGRTLPDRATRGHPPRPPSDEEAATPTPTLGGEEELLVVLRGVGAAMFLTNQRVILARDGMERRPRSGIQSFRLETILQLRLELGSSSSGRVVVWTKPGTEAVSMFFEAKSHDRAKQLVQVARPLIEG